jgi:site-specific DNA-methyltransferase (adenine-specific)
MTETASGHNPDILTCLANLSADEVFTPPKLASAMLDMLPQDLFRRTDSTFLDPMCKSGVFLREIARRLNDGLRDQMPDEQMRVDHILTRQVFGLATSELTAAISRRSVYCSKKADGKYSIATRFTSYEGNIRLPRTQHRWGGNGKCVGCGANKSDYDRGEHREGYAFPFIHGVDPRELFNMKFDVIVGNPPYQLGSSGGDAVGGFAMPIYQKFVDAAKRLEPHFVVMVTPSRWFAGGRGLDEFRSEMLADTRMRVLVDYPDAGEVFPGIQIKGGVSYFLWDKTWDGACEVTTKYGAAPTSPPMARFLGAYDVVVRRNEAVPILEKVLQSNARDGFGSLAAQVSPIQPFSIRTNFRGAETAEGMTSPVCVIGNGGNSFIERGDVPRNESWVDEWKVLLGRAYGAGDSYPHQIYNVPIVAGPGTACTETYLVISRFKRKAEASRFAGYLRTRFVRFLVSLRKNTQDIYNERFQFVPNLPMDRDWTDAILYERYGITEDEVAFIEAMVRPMGGADERE